MIYGIFFLICLLASFVGSICGIGGGVIIKPVLDAFHILDVGTVSFLSGCTVLSMSAYSVLSSRTCSEPLPQKKTGFLLAVGAAVGGISGKWLFSSLVRILPGKEHIGAVQAVCLLLLTAGSLWYTLKKDRIPTHQITSLAATAAIGILLGVLSSFLGIGGGPFNLVFLSFFFSMNTKTAAANSLYIIFFSQVMSLVSTMVMQNIPSFPLPLLLLMAAGGILGGMIGQKISRKISDHGIDRIFLVLMLVIMLVNLYNIYIFIR